MTHDGDELYLKHVYVYLVQWLFGLAFLISSHCMLRSKPVAAAPYLVPWFFTANFILELPAYPILPLSLRLISAYIVLPELFATLVGSGCHFVITTLCLGVTGCYLIYHAYDNFEVDALSPSSVPMLIIAQILMVTVIEIIRKTSYSQVR